MVTRETRSRSGHDLVTIWSRSGRVAGRWAGPWVKSSQVKTSQVKSMPGDGLAHGSSQAKSRQVKSSQCREMGWPMGQVKPSQDQ